MKDQNIIMKPYENKSSPTSGNEQVNINETSASEQKNYPFTIQTASCAKSSESISKEPLSNGSAAHEVTGTPLKQDSGVRKHEHEKSQTTSS